MQDLTPLVDPGAMGQTFQFTCDGNGLKPIHAVSIGSTFLALPLLIRGNNEFILQMAQPRQTYQKD